MLVGETWILFPASILLIKGKLTDRHSEREPYDISTIKMAITIKTKMMAKLQDFTGTLTVASSKFHRKLNIFFQHHALFL